MDSTHQKEATSHSGEPRNSASAANLETKVLRSSARVKAKQKEKERERVPAEQSSSSASTALKRSRESSNTKGKGKEVADEPSRAGKRCVHASGLCLKSASYTVPLLRVRRSAHSASVPLAINEPPKDTKGKKRAAPEDNSEGETLTSTSAPVKRTRTTTSYSLRSRDPASTSDMPKKTRYISTGLCSAAALTNHRSTTAGKGKASSARSKAIPPPIPSTSRADDDDVEMLDADYVPEDVDDNVEKQHGEDDRLMDDKEDSGETDEDDEEDADIGRADDGARGGSLDDSAPLSIFGDYRHLGSYMMGLSSRLKNMLNNIKRTADPTTRLLTLQELSELLSISTEDTLAGSFQVEAFVRELVRILGGTGNEHDEGDEEEEHEHDEDAALAAALALSQGGTAYQGDENLEAQVLACRCLANLMEALPGVAHTVVYHGAIPVLCSKLIEISYIDLAEQTLSVSENGVCGLALAFIDIFPDHGEDFGRVPQFYRSRGRFGRFAQLP